jgi:hypothetical protein
MSESFSGIPLLTPTEIARVMRDAGEPTNACVCGQVLCRSYRHCPQCGLRASQPDGDVVWTKLYSALALADCSARHIGRVNGPSRVDAFRHCPICGARLTYPSPRERPCQDV